MANNIKLSWTEIVPLPDPEHGTPFPRSSHGVSVVQDATRLILYGGENVARTPLDSSQACWAVDNLKDDESSPPRWRRIDFAKGGPPPRVAHAQDASRDGTNRVYVFGGRAGISMNEETMDDLWVLDCSGEPGTEAWSEVEQRGDVRPEARSFHRMVCVDEDRSLYVFGGCGAQSGRLNDLFRFDLATNTWHDLGASPSLRGRGGPNLLPLSSGSKLGVVAGFAGEETSDGHRFDLEKGAWEDSPMGSDLNGLRPRSVCVSGSFPTTGLAVIFGGEVDPSQKGHEGAGGFASDVVLLDEKTGALKETVQPRKGEPWPEQRGWSAGAGVADSGSTGVEQLYVFGGLSGDDSNPRRLSDLWRLDISS